LLKAFFAQNDLGSLVQEVKKREKNGTVSWCGKQLLWMLLYFGLSTFACSSAVARQTVVLKDIFELYPANEMYLKHECSSVPKLHV